LIIFNNNQETAMTPFGVSGNERVNASIHAAYNVCMYVCMYVCIFIYQQPNTLKKTNLYKHK